jgi:hypothetical protein
MHDFRFRDYFTSRSPARRRAPEARVAAPVAARTALSLLVGVAAAIGALLLQPPPAAAQGDRPSIRISGGHVYIGGHHAGSIGVGRDPHSMGRMIRGRLSGMGDPRAARFGPGRLGDRTVTHRYPWWIHPRTVRPDPFHPRAVHRGAKRPWPGHPGPISPWHPGLVVELHHPFGAVLFAHRVGWWRWTQVGVWVDETAAWEHRQERPLDPADVPEPRPRPAPYEPPPDRCADVTIWMLAGAVQKTRIDLETLAVETPEEAQEALERQLRLERRLALRGSRGDGIVVPAAMVRGLEATWCEVERPDADDPDT